MSDEAKLLPCPFCKGAMKFGKHGWFTHAEHNMGCIIGYEAFPPADVGNWNTRAIEATRPTEQGLGETLESISAWCEETFGPASPLRMAARANEEMAELIDVASRSETYSDKVLVEAADVVICLARFPGLWAAVEHKMAINRARVWRLTGEGTGYHVPQGDAHE